MKTSLALLATERRMLAPSDDTDWTWRTKVEFLEKFGQDRGEAWWRRAISSHVDRLALKPDSHRRIMIVSNSDHAAYTAEEYLEFFGPGLAEFYWTRSMSADTSNERGYFDAATMSGFQWLSLRLAPGGAEMRCIWRKTSFALAPSQLVAGAKPKPDFAQVHQAILLAAATLTEQKGLAAEVVSRIAEFTGSLPLFFTR